MLSLSLILKGERGRGEWRGPTPRYFQLTEPSVTKPMGGGGGVFGLINNDMTVQIKRLKAKSSAARVKEVKSGGRD